MSVALRYKAIRPDGHDFFSGTVDYLAGGMVVAPFTDQCEVESPATYLSVSTSAADCTGFRWPCRLLVVEPLHEWTPDPEHLPNKRACRALRVVDERPAHEAFGPNGSAVAALIERVDRLTRQDLERLVAAWDAAWDAARVAARVAARDAAWVAARVAAWVAAWDAAGDAAGVAARVAARDAARALVVADLIPHDHLRTLAGPWIDVIGDTREAAS